MRRLKLQMHISIDGMAGRQEGATHFNWDAELRQYSIENAANAGSILLGRKTAENFIPHWKSVADNPKAPDLELGRLITDKPKIVFQNLFRSRNGRTLLWRMAKSPNA